MRLRSRCTIATALPTIIESTESAATIFIHETCGSIGPIATKMRTRAISVAAFGATESHPATGDEAPWYTWGAQPGNGAGGGLKPSPAISRTKATVRIGVGAEPFASNHFPITGKFVDCVAPYKSAVP